MSNLSNRLAEIVRESFPTATDDEADRLLFEATAFPVCGIARADEQLKALAAKSGANPSAALRIANEEFEAEVEVVERLMGAMESDDGAAGRAARKGTA